jgi:cytidylate kinase
MIITIDGSAGTGKSTVAKTVAERMGLPYFDTGAMYRAVTYLILQKKITLFEKEKIADLLKEFQFEIKVEGGQKKYLANGQDVTQEIRSQSVNHSVSPVAALPVVRKALGKISLNFAKKNGGVFEGRDMGTVLFPKAKIKIFLKARPEVCAQRRLEEIMRKRPEEAHHLDQEKMLEELKRRDTIDSSRDLAPLKCPADAYVIDTSDISIEEVVERVLEYRREKNLKPIWLQWKSISFLYRFVLCGSWILAKVFFRLKVYGLEHFYPRGAIIAANHTSFLDPPLLAVSWPGEVHFLARETLFNNPIFGGFIGRLNTHPVSGDTGDVKVFKTICSLLSQGKKVVLFPEGRRSPNGQLGEIKPGMVMLVAKTATAIIPAYLDGVFEIWNRKQKFPKLFKKTVCVFGSPIVWDDFKHLDPRVARDVMAKKLSEAILGLKEWLQNGAQGVPP